MASGCFSDEQTPGGASADSDGDEVGSSGAGPSTGSGSETSSGDPSGSEADSGEESGDTGTGDSGTDCPDPCQGELLWEEVLDADAPGRLNAIAHRGNGDFYVVGRIEGGSPNDPTIGSGDGWVGRFNASNEQNWGRTVLAGGMHDELHAVALGGVNELYVCGEEAHLDPTNAGGAYVAQISTADGQELAADHWFGTNFYARFYDCAVTPDGLTVVGHQDSQTGTEVALVRTYGAGLERLDDGFEPIDPLGTDASVLHGVIATDAGTFVSGSVTSPEQDIDGYIGLLQGAVVDDMDTFDIDGSLDNISFGLAIGPGGASRVWAAGWSAADGGSSLGVLRAYGNNTAQVSSSIEFDGEQGALFLDAAVDSQGAVIVVGAEALEVGAWIPLVRKYAQDGSLQWSQQLDGAGFGAGQLRGVDIADDDTIRAVGNVLSASGTPWRYIVHLAA